MNDNTDNTETDSAKTDSTDDATSSQDEGRACEEDTRTYQAYVAHLKHELVTKAPEELVVKTKKKTQNDG